MNPLAKLSPEEAQQRARERFFSYVRKVDECWIWVGPRNGKGYGDFHVRARRYPAHRYAFLLAHGYAPRRLTHTCGHKDCVRPSHLVEIKKQSPSNKRSPVT